MNNKEKQKFFNTLEPAQKKVYTKIIDERKTIYYTGFAIGIVISIILIYGVMRPIHTRNDSTCSRDE